MIFPDDPVANCCRWFLDFFHIVYFHIVSKFVVVSWGQLFPKIQRHCVGIGSLATWFEVPKNDTAEACWAYNGFRCEVGPKVSASKCLQGASDAHPTCSRRRLLLSRSWLQVRSLICWDHECNESEWHGIKWNEMYSTACNAVMHVFWMHLWS